MAESNTIVSAYIHCIGTYSSVALTHRNDANLEKAKIL